MSDALQYTTIEDARAHGAICGHCHITAAEIKLFVCAGCKNQQCNSIFSSTMQLADIHADTV
jgi:hypothetical protein